MFDKFSWWHVAYMLLTTHITIVMVTVYLHRALAHRSLTVAKPLEHFFRFWCWLTTGQSPKQWAAVHRKHHAFCERDGDPHSPRLYGFWTVLFKGLSLYRKEAKNPKTLEKYGHFTPDDSLQRNFYDKYHRVGILTLGVVDCILFGWHGLWIYTLQLLWIPFWAAGVINGLGHFRGYKNFSTADDSTNIFPWGIIIGGEELHNNHHAYPTSAKLSVRWYEFDMGWMWIKIFEFFKLVKVNKTCNLPVFDKKAQTSSVSEGAVQAFLAHKSFILKMFHKHIDKDVARAIKSVKNEVPELKIYTVKRLKNIFYEACANLESQEKKILAQLLEHKWLQLIHEKKEALLALWSNKSASLAQLKEDFTQWCEHSLRCQHDSLVQFAAQLSRIKAS